MNRKHMHLTIFTATLFMSYAATSLHAYDDWPTFRGADRTNVAPDTGLLQEWPEAGPELVWEAAGAGRGYASVAISAGRIYTLGDALSTADDKEEYLTCFDQATGKQLWKSRTGPQFNGGQSDWQSSRSTPTVDGDRVYVITPQGTLVCLNVDGNEQWRVDLTAKFNGKKADQWGYSESVLIDGEHLICTPGGPENTMVALNKTSGEKVWSTSRAGDRGAGHASIVISEVGSTRVYVQTTGSGGMGVRATDGKLLWTYDFDETTAVIPTPIVRDDLVFVAAGYNRGGALLRQVPAGEGVKVDEIYPLNPQLNNKHGGIVLVGDYLYGDTDARGTPYCAEFMTGEIKWKSRGSGKGSASVVAADGHLYFRYSDGIMTLVKADPASFQEVSSFKVPGSGDRPSWAHPVILEGRLYLREGDKILCYSLVAKGNASTKPIAKNETKIGDKTELLNNGDFAAGLDKWTVENGNGETAKVDVVNEGPDGKPAVRITVLKVPDEAWQLQMYQPDLSIEKGKSYVLNCWMKAKSSATIKMVCMQNHEPWEHSTEQEVDVSNQWKQKTFEFDGPWDDTNGRVTFTNLGMDADQIFWFANASLTVK